MKKGIICYDLVLVPEYMEFEKVAKIAEKYGYLFFDSHSHPNAKPPYMLNPEEKLTKILVDVSTDEGKLIVKKLEDEKANR